MIEIENTEKYYLTKVKVKSLILKKLINILKYISKYLLNPAYNLSNNLIIKIKKFSKLKK